MLEEVTAPFASAWKHFKRVLRVRGSSELTLEDFRLELAELGLLGRGFGPEEYRAALEEWLGIEILVEELPDVEDGSLAGQLAAEGNLAEVVLDERVGRALVLVRGSLRYAPWPAYELSVFHELSHLAAGHSARMRKAQEKGEKRRFFALGGALPVHADPTSSPGGEKLEVLEEEVLEPEARKRAKWLLLAGMCPRAFEDESSDRLT